MTGRAYMGEMLIQIWLESMIRKLVDKQVNVQNESLFRGSRRLPYAHKKVCDENERRKQKKNDYCVKNFVVKGNTLKGRIRRMAEPIWRP